MNITHGDNDHVFNLITGFEALLQEKPVENGHTKYLRTCLSLEGNEFQDIAGQEGFMDKAKELGRQFYEMIKSFLKGIYEFLFGSNGIKKEEEIKQVLAKTSEVAKEIKKVDVAMEDEQKDKIIRAAVRLEPESFVVSIGFRKIKEQYLNNKDGFMKDVLKAAEHVDFKLPDITMRLNAVDKAYTDLGKVLKDAGNAKAEKTLAGAIKTVGEADVVGVQIGILRSALKTLQADVTVYLNKSNELTEKLRKASEGKASGTDEDKAYRASNKVSMFLGKLSTDVLKAIESCDRSFNKLYEGLGSVVAQLHLNDKDDFKPATLGQKSPGVE